MLVTGQPIKDPGNGNGVKSVIVAFEEKLWYKQLLIYIVKHCFYFVKKESLSSFSFLKF